MTDGSRGGAWPRGTASGSRRNTPSTSRSPDVAAVAREVAGEGHHFAAVQLPVNLAMAQALAYPSQLRPGGTVPALIAAEEAGLAAFGSASLLQGRLAADLPEEVAAAFAGATTEPSGPSNFPAPPPE